MADESRNGRNARPIALDAAELDAASGGTAPYLISSRFGENISGTLKDDVLVGDGGHDTLSGNAGDDQMEGGRGHDLMSGGFGDDTFVINVGDGNDTIQGQAGNRFGEWLSQGNVDRIVINGVSWDDMRIEFSKGGFSGEVHEDGTQKLHTNSAGVIYFGDQRIEFRGIERIQLPNDQG